MSILKLLPLCDSCLGFGQIGLQILLRMYQQENKPGPASPAFPPNSSNIPLPPPTRISIKYSNSDPQNPPANTRKSLSKNQQDIQRFSASVEEQPPVRNNYNGAPNHYDHPDPEYVQKNTKRQGCDCCRFYIYGEIVTLLSTFLLLQLPFLITNWLISICSQPSECLDKTYELGMRVRGCLLYTFLVDVALVGIVIVVSILGCLNLINWPSIARFVSFIIVVSSVKSLLWALLQIYLFHRGMAANCSGGLFAYGLIMLVLHYLQLVIVPTLVIITQIHLDSNRAY